jgi:putative transposase
METVLTHKRFAIIHEMAGNLISIQELCKIAGVSRSITIG